MDWIAPHYSKAQVKRAGRTLRTDDANPQALDIVSNWRAAHAYPLHALTMFLRSKATHIDKDALVVQRLKRIPSIIEKLRRFEQMSLVTMQDIAGCRVVVKTTSQAIRLRNAIVESRTRNRLDKEYDYIAAPKASGYRGIHLIYRYHGTKEAYQQLGVEIQIRTKMQHAWATAVEVVDLFTGQALKANAGSDDWTDFFRYASIEFARSEKDPIDPHFVDRDTFSPLMECIEQLRVFERLEAFAVTTKHIGATIKDADYYLLHLHMEEGKGEIRVIRYPQKQVSHATNDYVALEKEFQDSAHVDIVLVSAQSINNLKKAYPNYFADTRAFRLQLKKIMEKYEPQ